MNYDLILSSRLIKTEGDVSYSPVVSRLYVDTWTKVFHLLQWIHEHRFDFILTVDPQGRGWSFEIEQPGQDYWDIEQIKRNAGISEDVHNE